MGNESRIRRWLTDEAWGRLHAHRPNDGSSGSPETLEEHSDLVMDYAEMLMAHNGVENAVNRALIKMRVGGNHLNSDTRTLIMRFFREAIYLHDLGKINPAFQRKAMRNAFIGSRGRTYKSDHSMLSAVLYLHIYLRELAELENRPEGALGTNRRKGKWLFSFLRHVLYAFAYVISRHHTYLGSLEEADDKQLTVFETRILELTEDIRNCPELVGYYRDGGELLKECESAANEGAIFSTVILSSKRRQYEGMDTPLVMYTLVKLLYSVMVSSDFRATYHYMEQQEVHLNYFGEKLPLRPMLDAYQNGSIFQGIQDHARDPKSAKLSGMNRLRAELFLEADSRLRQGEAEYLFYLEGPTGSGKTNMSIHLGLQLLDSGLGLNKLLYVFPFNSLIEQTRKTLDSYFRKEELGDYKVEVINSITPMVTFQEGNAESKEEGQEPDYDFKSILLNRQLLQYPVTLTSHVNLFSYLFGTGREANLAFAHLCNSVIILDEIQSYRNNRWKEIIHFLRCFAEILNIRVIIMSATLPQLDELLDDQESDRRQLSYPLVLNRDVYFSNPLFRDRVKLHFEWLPSDQTKIPLSELLKKITSVISDRQAQGAGNRILIEFITKKSARKFYRQIREKIREIPVYELTGDDNMISRTELLKRLGKEEDGTFRMQNVIVVATQVIEAGVDIDMDVGFKDISLLDSEEQFLGRLNRSCDRENCHAYFFDLDNVGPIYRQDWRTEHDLLHESYQQMLLSKDFREFYRLNMRRINESRQKDDSNHWSIFYNQVLTLDFPGVQEHMDLIPEPTVTLFLNCIQTLPEGRQISGEQVWREYLMLSDPHNKMDYSERRVRLSAVREEMNLFTYTYRASAGSNRTPGIYSEQNKIGSLFYVEEGAEYMEPDEPGGVLKFNREKYTEAERGPLL